MEPLCLQSACYRRGLYVCRPAFVCNITRKGETFHLDHSRVNGIALTPYEYEVRAGRELRGVCPPTGVLYLHLGKYVDGTIAIDEDETWVNYNIRQNSGDLSVLLTQDGNFDFFFRPLRQRLRKRRFGWLRDANLPEETQAVAAYGAGSGIDFCLHLGAACKAYQMAADTTEFTYPLSRRPLDRLNDAIMAANRQPY